MNYAKFYTKRKSFIILLYSLVSRFGVIKRGFFVIKRLILFPEFEFF